VTMGLRTVGQVDDMGVILGMWMLWQLTGFLARNRLLVDSCMVGRGQGNCRDMTLPRPLFLGKSSIAGLFVLCEYWTVVLGSIACAQGFQIYFRRYLMRWKSGRRDNALVQAIVKWRSGVKQ
jgi:hypothetical protein